MDQMPHRTGWLRDLPDTRDWDASDYVLKAPKQSMSELVSDVVSCDWRKYCSPVENQGRLGSCVAQAIVGAVEYHERHRVGRYVNASRLFLYKMARQLDGFEGDTGAYIRTGMKALRLFGTPPERYWRYDVDKFDIDPPAFVFSLAQNWQSTRYFRIDVRQRDRAKCLEIMKQLLVNARPIVLGYRVYSYGNARGEIPMPSDGQRPRGGHAVLAVGYDDNYVIEKSRGALLIRNSWGRNWGTGGYGWLPYDYILEHLSADFWTLVAKESFM